MPELTSQSRMQGASLSRVGAVLVAITLILVGGLGEAKAAAACPADALATSMPGDAYVELLAARGSAIPSGRWPFYRSLARAVVACLRPGAHLTIRAIAPNSLAVPPLFAGTGRAEAGGANPLLPLIAQRQFIQRALAAIDTLPRRHLEDDSSYDPLGALTAAGSDFAMTPPGMKQMLLMLFNGWVQSRSINLFSFGSNPLPAVPPIIARLRAEGAMPDLHGSRVLIAGITAGDPRMRVGDEQLGELCAFWRLMVQAAHGELVACGASLPGVAVPWRGPE